MTDIERYHIQFGLHSNIPKCCINFFLDEWEEIWNDKMGKPYCKALDAANAGYVQCPVCLGKGIKVHLKICDVECGGEHQEDFRGD